MPSGAPSGAKLSLRRKKPPGGSGGEGAPGPGCPPSSRLQKQDLSNTKGAWMTLLRAVEPHLDHSSLEKIINLPKFLTKSSQTATPWAKPETFNAGMKEFHWIPFPLYQREDTKGSNSRRHQNSENETSSLIERENDEDKRPKIISPVPEQKSGTGSEHTSEVSKMNHSMKYYAQLGYGERFETRQHAHSQNSPGHSSLACTQSHLKEFEKLGERCSVQDEVESGRENQRENPSNNDTLVQHSTLFNQATSILPAQDPRSASFSGQGKAENHSLETPTLEKCPLCQMHFTGIWSELDVDSHLAKCLSESADSVVW